MALNFFDYRTGGLRDATSNFAKAMSLVPIPMRGMLVGWLRGAGLLSLQTVTPIRVMMDWWGSLESDNATTGLQLSTVSAGTLSVWYPSVITALRTRDVQSPEGDLLLDIIQSFQPHVEAAQAADLFTNNATDTDEQKNVGLRGVVQENVMTSAQSLANLITANTTI
jgi:hypothetical protein